MQDDGEDRHAEGDGGDRKEDFDRSTFGFHTILPGAELAGLRPFAQGSVGGLFLMGMMAPDAPK
jgi:hypothetical protein